MTKRKQVKRIWKQSERKEGDGKHWELLTRLLTDRRRRFQVERWLRTIRTRRCGSPSGKSNAKHFTPISGSLWDLNNLKSFLAKLVKTFLLLRGLFSLRVYLREICHPGGTEIYTPYDNELRKFIISLSPFFMCDALRLKIIFFCFSSGFYFKWQPKVCC